MPISISSTVTSALVWLYPLPPAVKDNGIPDNARIESRATRIYIVTMACFVALKENFSIPSYSPVDLGLYSLLLIPIVFLQIDKWVAVKAGVKNQISGLLRLYPLSPAVGKNGNPDYHLIGVRAKRLYFVMMACFMGLSVFLNKLSPYSPLSLRLYSITLLPIIFAKMDEWVAIKGGAPKFLILFLKNLTPPSNS